MTKRNYYMIIDTETMTGARTVFDLGYKVIDRKGNVYAEASYVVAETVLAESGIATMFADRFTRTKAPHYIASLLADLGEFTVADFATIRADVLATIAEYDATICAYNVNFDLNALEKTSNALLGCGFFDTDPEVLDIWAMALGCICTTAKFVQFVASHGITTEKGNPQTGAEAVYRFITGDPDFEEAHTAHADCGIEQVIFQKCMGTHKKLRRDTVRMCLHDPDWCKVCEMFHALG